MRQCTDEDIESVISVVSRHIPEGFDCDFLEEIFLHSLQNPAVKILMPDDESMCMFIYLGGGEYDMHTIGDSAKTNEAVRWMLDNYDGCRLVSWYPPNEALERVCRLADRKFGSMRDESGKHYLRKDMICHL